MANITIKIQRMNKYFLASILLFSFNFSIGQTIDNRLDGLEQDIETLMKSYNALGLSVSVVKNNQVVYSKGFGYRDLENKLPVNENTVFPIASCSKAFTASLLGILDYEEKISLKDKPSLHIPKLEFYNSEMDNIITIEDLLSHKSGLGEINGTLVLFPEQHNLEVIRKLKYIKPDGKPKDSWIYSNMGYTIAGTIVEQVTGESWEDDLKKNIFRPLGMSNSYTDITHVKETNNFSYGYGLTQGKVKKVLFEDYQNYKPAGGIRSSAKDMANWMIAWLNEGKFKEKQVLPKDFVRNATTIHNMRPNENEESVFLFGDGFGWRMESQSGDYKVYHGGNTSGFSTLVLTYPFKKLGITVLTNQTNSTLPYIIGDIIKNRLLELPRVAIENYPVLVEDIYIPTKVNKELHPEKKPTHSLLSFVGKYENKGYGTIEVEFKEGNLYAIYPTYKFFLEHLHHNIFVMKPLQDVSDLFNPEFAVNFRTKNNGEISSLTINLQSEPVEFTKQMVE
jgi:CubicO group peptidase (beta-lactamase class C family)